MAAHEKIEPRKRSRSVGKVLMFPSRNALVAFVTALTFNTCQTVRGDIAKLVHVLHHANLRSNRPCEVVVENL